MSIHLKELIVVLGLALAVFAAAKPICLTFMYEEDFKLRRNVWLILTVGAFLAPNFWIYAFVALAVLGFASRKDSNPVCLYLLAYAIIPPFKIYIPVVGINQLFDLSQGRILAFVVLLPLAFRLFAVNEDGLARRWTLVDSLLVAFVVLQVALVSPYESITNTLRRGLLFFIDTLLVYYVFSRAINSRRAVRDAMAVFVLTGALYAAIGIFESFKGWLLYEQIGPDWGALNDGAFLLRGDALRAQVSLGHSLTLGYFLAMALGLWLYLRNEHRSRIAGSLVTALLCVGLFVTHSRGPWLTGIVVYVLYLFFSPGSTSRVFKGLAVMGSLGGVIALTPLGSRIMERLPFIGTADQDNVIYRQRLAEESWQLILQNPWFGDPFVTARMEHLKQGQGIIDLMNAYAATALFHGLVGAGLFVAFFVVASARAYAMQRATKWIDPDLSAIGAALVACMLASLFFMATASVDWVEYVLAGLLVSYASLTAREMSTMAAREPGRVTMSSGHQSPAFHRS